MDLDEGTTQVIQLRRQPGLLAVAIFWLLSVVAVPASASLGSWSEGQEGIGWEAARSEPTVAPKGGLTEEAASLATKKMPNPYGKLGSPAHRAKVAEIAEDIRARGLIPGEEFPVSTVGGAKSMRQMDVVAIDPATGKVVEVHQVGRVLKSDPLVPVARERAALRDVRRSPVLRGAKRIFHEY
jgi:hypothetical protein